VFIAIGATCLICEDLTCPCSLRWSSANMAQSCTLPSFTTGR